MECGGVSSVGELRRPACAVGLRRRPAPSACAVGLRRRPMLIAEPPLPPDLLHLLSSQGSMRDKRPLGLCCVCQFRAFLAPALSAQRDAILSHRLVDRDQVSATSAGHGLVPAAGSVHLPGLCTSLLLCSHLAELCLYSRRLLVHQPQPEQRSHSSITLCLPALASG